MEKYCLRQGLSIVKSKGVTARSFLKALQGRPSFADFFVGDRFSSVFYRSFPLAPKTEQPHWEAVEKDLQWEMGINHHIISIWDKQYPKALREILDPPLALYMVGTPCLERSALAVVGARQASPQGVKQAYDYARALAAEKLSIISGLAVGIDAAAHQGALSYPGHTVGVLAHGLHQMYPKANLRLARQMIEAGGAIVSEYGVGVKPERWQFVRRNRIISGLSLGVLVVEASEKSGSLTTARYALEQGREVFALPGPVDHSLSSGCHALIREGAVLVGQPKHITQELLTFSPY
ncbi:MAG: DNA-protecting protein DprA [Legionellales bacterium]|nr:DNA-protecting protein DprA [Legionellales bacterium]|tara:strand:- start:1016 stop:1894 length:879 start_codon:yes stop_codon:yes gene_type:complete